MLLKCVFVLLQSLSLATYTELGTLAVSGTIIIIPANKEVEKGTEVVLSCFIENITETATVVWSDGIGSNVTTDGTSYVVEPGAYNSSTNSQTTTLTVKAGTNTQDTTFTCEITADNSTSGDGTVRATVMLYVYEVELPDKSIAAFTNATILQCAITGVFSPRPPATVAWKDPAGNLITDGTSGYTIFTGSKAINGKLKSKLTIGPDIMEVLETESVFTCEVTSGKYPNSKTSVTNMILTKMEFGMTGHSTEVEVNTRAVVWCAMAGLTEQLESVSWRDSSDNALTSGGTYLIEEGNYTSNNSQSTSLTVVGGLTRDAVFWCVVARTDEWGNVRDNSTQVNLNVFEVILEDKTVETSTAQTITCAITGLSQAASVTWADPDGATIVGGDYYTVAEGIESGGSQASLLTISAGKLDAIKGTAVFTCHVTSGLYPDSEVSSNSMTLTIIEPDPSESSQNHIGWVLGSIVFVVGAAVAVAVWGGVYLVQRKKKANMIHRTPTLEME